MTLVSGTYIKASGRADRGYVAFRPIPPATVVGGEQVTSSPITVSLDYNGHFSVDLIPDPDYLGVDGEAYYLVTENVGTLQRSWYLTIQDTTPIDLPSRYPGTVESGSVAILPLPGPGVPPGGTPGQVVAKASSADYDTHWADGGIGGGGVSDHGALSGLADDDHPQYARSDGTRGSFEALGAVAAHVGAGDPHTQYVIEPNTPVAGVQYALQDGTWVRVDSNFYTESEANTLLAGKANISHTHTKSQITDFSHTHSIYPDSTGQTAGLAAKTDGANGWTFSDPSTWTSIYGEHLVVWNGTAWRYRGQTVTVRPTTAAYSDGGRVLWDTSMDQTVTTPPALAVLGDVWFPHGSVVLT
jgi:hypothetical protein